MKTLIVDDDATSRDMLTQILKPFGPVDVAPDGVAALDAVHTAHDADDPYHLICLDIMMPVLDGQHTLREIRNLEKNRGIQDRDGCRVIMTTSLDDKRNILDAFNSRCEAYLIKPIQHSALFRQLMNLELITHEYPNRR